MALATNGALQRKFSIPCIKNDTLPRVIIINVNNCLKISIVLIMSTVTKC